MMSTTQNSDLASIHQLIYGIACALVDDEASVSIEMDESDMETVVGLRVADSDMGRLLA